MSTYHYDGSPCPESCTCAVREVDRLRAQLEAVTRERDALLDERRLVALELGCGLRVPLPGRLADVAAHFVAQVRIGEARLTRERDEAQAVLRKCHEVAWPRGGDLNGDPVCDLMLMRGTFQAHITTLERERDAARETIQHGIELRKQVERERDEARADAARLREALLNAEDKLRSAAHVAGEYVTADRTVAETNWRQLRNRLMEANVGVRAALASTPSAAVLPVVPSDHADHGRGTAESGPDESDCGCRLTTQQHECAKAGCGFCRVSQARAALASTPSAEPTPRDMRVAEAVAAEAATIVRHPSGPEGEDGYSLDDLAQRIEDLDLAAVVAKAAKAVKP